MKKIIFGIIVLLGCFIGIGIFMYFFSSSQAQNTAQEIQQNSTQPKTYEHTFPQQVMKNDFFQGIFIKNDVAEIYPRREALVKDILVDIGDEVEQGQTLAILFEPGVSGQADSNIGLKSTMLQSRSKILTDTEQVAAAKIEEFDTKIKEKEVFLQETLNNYEVKISWTQNLYDTKTQSLTDTLEVEKKVLSTLQLNLENARNTKDEKLSEAENNISQKEKLLDAKIDEVYTGLIPLIYIGEEHQINYEDTRKGDLSDFFSARNFELKNMLLGELSRFQRDRYILETSAKYELILQINRFLVSGLENTVYSVGNTDEATVKNYISKAKMYETTLLQHKEIYDDTFAALGVLKMSEAEKISHIEQKIEEQKAAIQKIESERKLFVTDNSVELTQSEKKLQIEKLKAELDTLRKSRDLLVATEQKQITSAANSVDEAQADLNKEYIASGNYKIISPFSGIISKRSIEIGAMISPKNDAFRIAGVDNSLSRITKQEIKFFVPENLQDQIELNQEVYFFTGNESKSFTGTVYRVSPEIDSATRSITVQAKVEESIKLSNKSSIRVALKSATLTYKIPTAVIYNKDERKIVYYKKDNGKLGVQDITILSDDGEYSLISGDFDTTLQVVTTPIFVK